MLDIDRSEQVLERDVLTGGEPGHIDLTSVDLVPVTQSVHWSPKNSMARPDPGFVTQLIATAAQAPQTRSLRRASLADAKTAYGAGQGRRDGVGFRTRQTI
jgi:hypothetical protein